MLSSDARVGLAMGAREGLPPRGRSRRWFWITAAVVALSGFTAVAYYLPTLIDRGAQGIPLIKADTRPFKEHPEDPGGLEVPHQGMEIYSRIGNTAPAAGQPKVERLLPPPEAPLPRPEPLPPAALTPPPPPVDAAPPPAVAEAPPPAAPPAPATPGAPPVQSAAPPAAVPPAAVPPAAVPPAAAAAPKAPPAQAAVAPPPATAAPPAAPEKPAPPPAKAEEGAKTGYRVQVGSVRSADSATTETARLRRTYADLLGRVNMNVVRAALPSGSAVYRLQAGPMTEDKARDLCDKLKDRKVGCLVIKP